MMGGCFAVLFGSEWKKLCFIALLKLKGTLDSCTLTMRDSFHVVTLLYVVV